MNRPLVTSPVNRYNSHHRPIGWLNVEEGRSSNMINGEAEFNGDGEAKFKHTNSRSIGMKSNSLVFDGSALKTSEPEPYQ